MVTPRSAPIVRLKCSNEQPELRISTHTMGNRNLASQAFRKSNR